MVINSCEFVRFVERHILKNDNRNEWDMKIDRFNKIGLLNPTTYQALKMIIQNT